MKQTNTKIQTNKKTPGIGQKNVKTSSNSILLSVEIDKNQKILLRGFNQGRQASLINKNNINFYSY